MAEPDADRASFVWGYVTMAVAVVTLGALTVWKPDTFDPGVVLPLIGTLIGAAGIIMTVHQQADGAAKQHEHERKLAHERALEEQKLAHSRSVQELRLQSISESQEAYDGFSTLFRELLAGGDELDLTDPALKERFLGMKFALLHYASNETLKHFSEWSRLASLAAKNRVTGNPKVSAANLIFYARLIRSMRSDLGWPSETMEEEEVLRFFVTDIDDHLERLAEAKTWTSAEDVPIEAATEEVVG